MQLGYLLSRFELRGKTLLDALLELLARHSGQVFARERLIDALWDADFAAESNIVEVYIRSLRRKVDDGRRDGLIETVRGAGYRLRIAHAD